MKLTFRPDLRTILIAALALSLLANAALYLRVHTLENDPVLKAQAETRALLTSVGKLMILPDETPTVATVTDPAQLQGQAFFAKAKKGDKVLIFTQARKAVLYDPVADRIVDVAPINAGSSPPPAPADTAVPAKAKTKTPGK
jgi:hypothetical protein